MFVARRVAQRAAAKALREWRFSSQLAAVPSNGPHPHILHVRGERVLRMRVRGEEIPSTPQDALAMVRAVERRFGRVAIYQFIRDGEISTRYQFSAYLAFADPDTYSRVPKDAPTAMSVNVPQKPHILSGGLGLSDLTSYLDRKDWTENDLAAADALDHENLPEEGSRTILFEVEHFAARFHNTPVFRYQPPPPRPNMTFLMQNFVRWGGFAPKESLPEPPTITRSDLYFGSETVDHPRMRQQLLQWHVLLATHRNKSPSHLPLVKPRGTNAPAFDDPSMEELSLSHARAASSEPDTPASTTDPLPSALPWMSDVAADRDPVPTSDVTSASSRFPSLTATPPSPSPTSIVEEESTPQLASTSPIPPPPTTPLISETTPLPFSPNASPEEASPSPASPRKASPPSKPADPPVTARSQRSATATAATAARRNDARNARVVMQKVKQPESVAKAAPPPQPAANVQQVSTKKDQPGASAEKKKKKKAKQGSSKQSEETASPTIEVEERTSGMTSRLRGMLRGWL
ncbi:hypothetical protein R3P38DRAFT_2841726 [Favolaschia claudopus]|uniref:Uncharacterized protein n=1 Tax=Favolaschia claudopus TaxID=2862362 RepID=A0AAW0E263_9AGAR